MPSFIKTLMLGLPGILAVILTVNPPDGVPALMLAVNPLALLIVGALAGTWAVPRVRLKSTIIFADPFPMRIVVVFAVAGLISGMMVAVIDHWAAPIWNPGTMRTLRQQSALQNLPVSLFYGGFTEEIIFRWGLMALLAAWAMAFVPQKVAVWIGVGLSALLFACAHLPAVALEAGSLTVGVVYRTLIWNVLLGLLFGAAFARGGLEAAMGTHFSFHIGVLTASNI
jgi:hypothetical protein